MISFLLETLFTLVIVVHDTATHPTSEVCPGVMWINGVRPSGVYECVFDDPSKIYADCSGAGRCVQPPPSPLDFSFRGRIFCDGSMPMQDGQRIWCGPMRRELQERSARAPWQGYPARVCVQRGANQGAFGARARHGARHGLRSTL